MRKISQLALLLALFFAVTSNVQASLLVEPLIGYNFNGKLGSASQGTGASFGGRLGYQNLGLQLGLDYLRSTLEYDRNWTNNAEFETNEYAAFIGYKFPILFRVYAAYIFSATGEVGSTKATDGTGTKLGASFSGLPFVNLNLEYRTGTFDKVTTLGINTGKADFSALLLSVSLPLTF